MKQIVEQDGVVYVTTFVPAGNCYRMTGELSRGTELFYAFLERSRRPKPVQENILQDG